MKDWPHVPSQFPVSGYYKIALVGESPGDTEVSYGKPFVGKTGKWLDKVLEEVGIRRAECLVTNAINYQPPIGLSKRGWTEVIQEEKPRLARELRPAKYILSMGAKALQALIDKQSLESYVGHPIFLPNNQIILPTFHPTYAAFYAPALRMVFKEHLRRFKDLMEEKWSEDPIPTGIIEPGNIMLEQLRCWSSSTTDLASDIENIPGTNIITAIGFSDGVASVAAPLHDYSNKYGFVEGIKHHPLGREIEEQLRLLLNDGQRKVVFHYGTHDVPVLNTVGFETGNYCEDTFLADSLVAQQQPHNLQFAACRFYRFPLWKSNFKFGHTDEDQPTESAYSESRAEDLRQYCCGDVYATMKLWQKLKVFIYDDPVYPNIEQHYRQLFRLEQLGAELYKAGWRISEERRPQLIAALEPRREDYLKKLQSIAAGFDLPDYNPRSHLHNKKLFIDGLHAMVLERSEKTDEPSITGDVLQEYMQSDDDRLSMTAYLLLSYREIDKLIQTYLVGLPLRDGRLHSKPNFSRVITGRAAFYKPSIQVIPDAYCKKDGSGKLVEILASMRDMYVADEGCLLIQADYKQLEARLVGYLSNDPVMINVFESGADFHSNTARNIFGENFTDPERSIAKNVIFADLYGATPTKIYKMLKFSVPGITLHMVELVCKGLRKTYPTAYQYQQQTTSKAREQGYVEYPIGGRRRYFFQDPEDITPTEACNAPIQGSGAGIINPATIAIDDALKQPEAPRMSLRAQVHDALVYDCAVEDVWGGIQLIKKKMEAPVKLHDRMISFPVDISIGLCWGKKMKVPEHQDVGKMESVETKEQVMSYLSHYNLTVSSSLSD